MKKNGFGGGNTQTGLVFEGTADLKTLFNGVKGYHVNDENHVFYNEKCVGRIFKKFGFYKYLEENNVDWKSIVSKRLLPDDSIYEATEKAPLGVLILLLRYSFQLFTTCKRPHCVPRASLSHPTETFSVSSYVLLNNVFYVIECKYQEVAGSVDEKLQTCDFKKKQYMKLLAQLNIEVEYIYILNDWFKDPKYQDVLDYIQSVGCGYYFNYIPLMRLGLPVPE